MKRRTIWIVPILVLGLWMLANISCDNSTEVDDPGCNDNSAPFLGKLYYSKNGGAYTTSSETEPIGITYEDTLRISYEFIDYDCNLNGGKIYLKVEGSNRQWENSFKEMPSGTPCSYEEINPSQNDEDKVSVDLSFNTGPIEGGIEFQYSGLEPGVYSFQTFWLDTCDSRSEVKEGYFEIISEDSQE